MLDFTTMAIPIANVQVYEKVLLPTFMADRCCGLPTPDGFNTFATLFRLPLHLEHEFTEGKVRHLSSPKPFHVSVKVQVLEKGNIKLSEKFKCQFPVMIFALIDYLAVRPGIVLTRTFAIIATSLLARQLPIGTSNRVRRLFIELWRLIFRVIRTGQKGLVVSIVKPCSITRLGFRSKTFKICCDTDIPITQCVLFDSDAFDITLNLARIPETIPDECQKAHSALIPSGNADLGNSATCILFKFLNLDLFSVEGHRAIFTPTFEFGWTFRSAFKEVDVAALYTFQAFLQRPRVWDTPMRILCQLLEFRQVLTHSVIGCTLIAFTGSVNAVVSPRQRNEVVRHLANDTLIRFQMGGCVYGFVSCICKFALPILRIAPDSSRLR